MTANYINRLILSKLNELSATEAKIAQYIMDEGQGVITKTLSDMSNDTNISQSSIYNFIVKLGFDGMQDFKISIASHSSQATSEEQEDRKLTVFPDINSSNTPMELVNKIVQINITLLEKLVSDMDENQLQNTLDILTHTKTLHFAGQGGSSTLAYNSYHKFLRAPIRSNYNSDFHMQLSSATKFTEEDTMILFSHSGETKDTIKLAQTAQQYNAKVIVLTGNPFGKLLNYADSYFIVSSKESMHKRESLNSQIAYVTMMDILFVSFLLRDTGKSSDSIQNIRTALS